MNAAAYEILALAARYWFVFLIGYILYRTIENSYLEYKYDRNQKQETPDSRYLGYLKVTEMMSDRKELQGSRFFLLRDNILGRSRNCNIVIDDPTISNTHAEIFLKGGKLYIQDTQSKNGTLLNGKRLKKKQQLYTGDMIQIGNVLMAVTVNNVKK